VKTAFIVDIVGKVAVDVPSAQEQLNDFQRPLLTDTKKYSRKHFLIGNTRLSLI